MGFSVAQISQPMCAMRKLPKRFKRKSRMGFDKQGCGFTSCKAYIYITEYIWCSGGGPRVIDIWFSYSELAVCLQMSRAMLTFWGSSLYEK